MAIATMTTKGRITIPKDIRKQLHLHSGDKVEIVVNNEEEALIRPVSAKVDDVIDMLQTDKKAISIKEMNRILKDKFHNNI